MRKENKTKTSFPNEFSEIELFLEVTIKLIFGKPLVGNFVAGRKIHLSLFHLCVSAESSPLCDLVTATL